MATMTMTTTTTTTTTNAMSLEDIAQALTFSVDTDTQKCKKTKKKFKHVFVGSEAVEILMQLAHLQSRDQAVDLGRTLQHSFGLFECVNSKKVELLEDDSRLLYRFVQNATSGNRGKSEELIKNLEDKMRSFQRGVRVKDRSLRLTTYKNCFVGKEAVDYMMRVNMAPTRQDCVELGRILRRRYNLFVPMTGDHDFEDDAYKFYRLLLPQKDKVKQPSFFDEIKPARMWIGLSLIPACLIYYYLY